MNIEIKHFNNQFKSKPIHHLNDDFGDSNTDTSTWRPDLSVIHAQASSLVGSKRLVYDFPDGKDNGEYIQTFIRTKGLDITEIETAEQRITKIIESKKEKDKSLEDSKKQRQTDLKDLSDAIKGSESESSTDSSTTNA